MAYVAQKPAPTRSSNELRESIPGWGVDLDPANRPAVPKEHFNPQGTGAHWDFPERQTPRWARERSPEHRFLTPVFGTSCPPKGLSGLIRRYAYRFSEGRALHWLLLMGADRVDILESRIQALLSGRPDSRVLESGVLSEFKRGGLRARVGKHRADVKHQWIDVLMFAAPYIALAGTVYLLTRRRTRNAPADTTDARK
jgi:hypothetical protein